MIPQVERLNLGLVDLVEDHQGLTSNSQVYSQVNLETQELMVLEMMGELE